MKSLTQQIHLKNMLSCLSEIESYCADLTLQQLKDPELLKSLHTSFTILGLEAANSQLKHPIIETLKSFIYMDFEENFINDRYALYSFITNDFDLIRSTLLVMRTTGGNPVRRRKNRLLMAS